jgi:hypothetical protein
MKFDEAEIRFLLQPHGIETANGRTRELRSMVDLRTLGCPAHLLERVLEDRARKLGNKFTEFRNQQAAPVATPQPSLVDQVAAAKLF